MVLTRKSLFCCFCCCGCWAGLIDDLHWVVGFARDGIALIDHVTPCALCWVVMVGRLVCRVGFPAALLGAGLGWGIWDLG